jgi:hypothetical protein
MKGICRAAAGGRRAGMSGALLCPKHRVRRLDNEARGDTPLASITYRRKKIPIDIAS